MLGIKELHARPDQDYAASVRAAKDKGEPVPDKNTFEAAYDKIHGTGARLTEDEFEKKKQEALSMLEDYGKMHI